jgi:hypothetical protein
MKYVRVHSMDTYSCTSRTLYRVYSIMCVFVCLFGLQVYSRSMRTSLVVLLASTVVLCILLVE